MMSYEYSDPEFIKLQEKVHRLEIAVAKLETKEAAADRALTLAHDVLVHNQAVANEWRQENIDQRSTYPTISKVEGLFATESAERRALAARLNALEKEGVSNQSKTSAFSTVWLNFVVVATLILAAIGVIYGIWR